MKNENSSSLSVNQRINTVDIAKGITILLVILGHYIKNIFASTLIWSFHIPLFIIISGYLFKRRDFKRNLTNSFKKLYVPYLLTGFFLLLCEIPIFMFVNRVKPTSGMPIPSVILRRLISILYALASNHTVNKPDFVVKIGAVWFLSALFFGRLLLNLILKIKKPLLQFLTAASLFVLACIQTKYICLPLSLNYACAFSFWMLIGVFIKKYNIISFLNRHAVLKIVFPLLWLGVFAVEYITTSSFNIVFFRFPLYGLEILGALFGSFTVYTLCCVIDKHTKTVRNIIIKLGSNTIWVLCVHALDIEIWNYAYSYIPLPRFITIPVRMIADVLAAYLLKKIHHCIKGALEDKK